MVIVHAYGEPRPGGSKKVVTNRRTGQAVLIEDSDRAAKAWRRELASQGRIAMRHRTPLVEPLALGAIFLLPRPRTVTRRLPVVKKADLDKLLRPLDSFTGLVWKDDSQVVATAAWKQYADELAPGAILVVHELAAQETHAEAIELVLATLGQVLELRGKKTRAELLPPASLVGPVDGLVVPVAERDEVPVDVVATLAPVDQVVPLQPAGLAAQTALPLEP